MNTIILFALTAMLPGQTMPPLQVRESVVDRGDIKAGAPLSQTFELKNRGEAPIKIMDVVVGCGCQKPRLSRKEVPVGETAELVVEVNTLSQSAGPNSWKSTVRYAEAGQPPQELELLIKAKIVRDITVEPVALSLSVDKETRHTFTLTDRRAKALTIIAAKCDSREIKTDVSPRIATAGGEQTQCVQVTIPDSFPAGRSAETLYLTTDDPEYRELRVPITIVKKAPGQVLAAPEQIDLRLAKGQTAASVLVRLRDPDGRLVVIDRIEGDQPLLRFKSAEGPGSMATVRLGVELGSNPASGAASVKVHIKEPRPQVLVIPISWEVP